MKKPWIAIIWFAVWGLFQAYAVFAVLTGRWSRPDAFPEEAYNALIYPDIFFIPVYFVASALLVRNYRFGYIFGLMASGAVTYVMIYLLALSGLKGMENLIFDGLFLTVNTLSLIQIAKRNYSNSPPIFTVSTTKAIIEEAQHYTREALSLCEDVHGARMWAVALKKTMLTYFDVEPHSRFENHSHESEQITLVLEGELFFETGGKTIAVKEGEVIAIPSNVIHAVFTKDKPVKAVDAWSPVMGKYRKQT